MTDESNHHTWLPMPTAGTRVLVTGALGGIGGPLCGALESCGCRVVGIDIIDGVAGSTPVFGVDLSDSNGVADVVSRCGDALGGFDAVIGAAGIVDIIHRVERFPPAAFERDIAVNLTAQFLLVQASSPYLANGSRIVLVSSAAAFSGLPGQAAYAAAKAGLIGLARTLAVEWAPREISVNAVAPGLVATDKVMRMPAEIRERFVGGVPLRRIGLVYEVVGTLLFLLSPPAAYITGQVIRVDGGQGLDLYGLHR